jgi:hypothetical protein
MSDTPNASESVTRAGARWLVVLIWLAVGLALRLAHAEGLGDSVFEWEADGFVAGWEGWSWGHWNRMRPPGWSAAFAALVEWLSLPSVRMVRWLCVGLSLVGLLAALELARSVSARTGLGRRSMGSAAAWAAALWALHPTLIRSSVSPTPELLLAPALCLLAAGLVAARSGALGWFFALVAASLAVAVGGVVVLAGLVVGLVVYLLPVPPLAPAARALGLVVVAGVAFWALQRGPSLDRPWVPDVAPVYGALAWLEAPDPHPNDVPSHADRAAMQRIEMLGDALRDAEPVPSLLALGRRVRDDVLGPARLEPLTSAVAASPPPVVRTVLGWFDIFLRGGSLLFACTVLGLLRQREPTSSLPRAGVVVGLLALLLFASVGAVGPLVMAPFDLLLLGFAAGGVAGTSVSRAWTRRVAFGVGGVLLCTFLFTAGMRWVPLSPWIGTVGQLQTEGSLLVELLDTPDTGDADAEFRTANLMMQARSPFLRLPEAAMTHALQATRLAPTNGAILELMVRAQVENAQYRDAARLAESGLEIHVPGSFEAKRAALLLEWVHQEERTGKGLPPAR